MPDKVATLLENGEDLELTTEQLDRLVMRGMLYLCEDDNCNGHFYHIDPKYTWNDVDYELSQLAFDLRRGDDLRRGEMKAKDRRKAEAEKKRRWVFDGGRVHYLDIGIFRLSCWDAPIGERWHYEVRAVVPCGVGVARNSGCKDLVEAKVQALSAFAEYLGSCMKQVSEVEDPICG
jgi:hypothetical protein